jgi:hypothetical protein
MMRKQVVLLGVVSMYRLRSSVFKVNPSGYCNKSIKRKFVLTYQDRNVSRSRKEVLITTPFISHHTLFS